jgi:hypothetical protein
MEDNIFDLIIESFEEGMNIPLIRNGKFYIYIGVNVTRINNISFNSIQYKISEHNSKRITRQFIELTYEYLLQNNNYPNRNWYVNHPTLYLELKSRPCNKTVARGLIETVR